MNGNFFKYAVVAVAGIVVGIALMKNKDTIIDTGEKILDSAKNLKDKAVDNVRGLTECAKTTIKEFNTKS